MRTALMAALFISLICLGNLITAGQTNPQAVVANLYRAAKTKNIARMSKTELKKYFDEDLADSIWRAVRSEEGLRFSVLYFAQDTKITNFQIGRYRQAQRFWGWVPVRFNNFGEPTKINFKMSEATGSGWRIIDVEYPDHSNLTQILDNVALQHRESVSRFRRG